MFEWVKGFSENSAQVSFSIIYMIIVMILSPQAASIVRFDGSLWLFISIGLAPMVITTRRILKKRTARYLSQLMDNKVRTYDMDKTLLEYIAMLKPRKRRFRLFWIKI